MRWVFSSCRLLLPLLAHPAACAPGWGPYKDGLCRACTAGTAKNVVSTKECSFCLDGFIANANKGPTDCLDNTRRRRSRAMLQHSFEEESSSRSGEEEESSSGRSVFALDANVLCARDGPTTPAGYPDSTYDEGSNSCICPAGTVLEVSRPFLTESGKLALIPLQCATKCPKADEVIQVVEEEAKAGKTECKKCPSNAEPNHCMMQTRAVASAGGTSGHLPWALRAAALRFRMLEP